MPSRPDKTEVMSGSVIIWYGFLFVNSVLDTVERPSPYLDFAVEISAILNFDLSERVSSAYYYI